MYQQQSAVNSQNTEDDLKILLRILSILYSKITSLINTRDWALYAWTSLHTCRVCTATESQVFQQSSFPIGKGPFNPHLLGGFSCLQVQEYRIPGAEISEHRRTTVQGIFQGVVI